MPKPSSEAAITKVTKEGGWYRFDGIVDGRRLGVRMAAPDRDTMGDDASRRYALDMLKSLAEDAR